MHLFGVFGVLAGRGGEVALPVSDESEGLGVYSLLEFRIDPLWMFRVCWEYELD